MINPDVFAKLNVLTNWHWKYSRDYASARSNIPTSECCRKESFDKTIDLKSQRSSSGRSF